MTKVFSIARRRRNASPVLHSSRSSISPRSKTASAPMRCARRRPRRYRRLDAHQFRRPLLRNGDARRCARPFDQHDHRGPRTGSRHHHRRSTPRIAAESPRQLEPNASLALGTSEVTPIELTTAYATFASGGFRVYPYFVTEVDDSQRPRPLQRKAAEPQRVIASHVDRDLTAMLYGVITEGTGRSAAVPATRPPAKRERRRIIMTPGLSASRRIMSPASGSATTIPRRCEPLRAEACLRRSGMT